MTRFALLGSYPIRFNARDVDLGLFANPARL